ncbi:MAG TPA: PP2C family protein-serine/threonine phosphatase [Terriglobales bacterium]
MARNGLWPTTRYARVACFILAFDLLLFALKKILDLSGKAYGQTLNFWVSLLGLVAFALFLSLAYRWLKARTLWRLRNKLIVTYVFIGVIPAVMLVAISYYTLNVFAGQFANYVVTSELNAELRDLAMANSAIAGTLAAELEHGAPLTPDLIDNLQRRESGKSSRQVCAWRDAKSTAVCGGKVKGQGFAPPVLSGSGLEAIVEDGNRFHIRSVSVSNVKGQPLTVVTSEVLDSRVLEKIATDLGEVTLVPNSPSAQTRVQAVKAGTLPGSSGNFDLAIIGAAPITVLDWNTGKEWRVGDEEGKKGGLLQVETRAYRLYGKMFGPADFGSGWGLIILLTTLGFGVIVILALVIGTRLTRSVTGAVAQLYLATRHINEADFSHRIPVKSNDQLATLAHSFNSMSESLQKLLEEQKEKQKLENELVIAQEVQAQLFPRKIIQLPSLEVHGFCRPARTVSGDYYDFLPVDDHRMVMAVGDVSGKGISAALLMATINSAVRAYTLEGIPILRESMAAAKAENQNGLALAVKGVEVSTAALLRLLNHQLFESTPAEKYATMFLGFYDGRECTLTYSNAGHLPPIILGHGGAIRRLDRGGTVVGLFGKTEYEECVVKLADGDIFLAYSDGITEPENDYGEFGEQRLINLVWENRHLPLAKISEIVTAAVDDWIGPGEQPDDVTLVLARVR